MNLRRKIICLLAFFTFSFLCFVSDASAEVMQVEVEGRYPVDEVGGSFSKARELAEKDALRKAAEEVSILVENYSKEKDGYLTKDEISSIAVAILRVSDIKFAYRPNSSGEILATCRLIATADTDDIELQQTERHNKQT